MDKEADSINNARRRLKILAEVMRWIWCVNGIAAIAAIIYGRIDTAVLAGVTWVLALIALGVIRSVNRYLGADQQLESADYDAVELPDHEWTAIAVSKQR